MSKKIDDHKSENPPKDPESDEEEIISGVATSMVKPFNKDDWTQEMKEEVNKFTSIQYSDEDTYKEEDVKIGNDDKDVNLMTKEKDTKKIQNNGEI